MHVGDARGEGVLSLTTVRHSCHIRGSELATRTVVTQGVWQTPSSLSRHSPAPWKVWAARDSHSTAGAGGHVRPPAKQWLL